MRELEIKRGYEVLPDNNVRFGIRVINSSDYAISDVEVILDYSETLFVLEGSKVQKLGTIPPTTTRTAEFVLKPRGCIHKEEIGAVVIYKDHQWKRHTQEMRPKEVHCVCPYLKEKSITRADFLALSNSGYLEEQGVNFEGISDNKLVDFIFHTCKRRLYRVDEFSIEGGKILYLAGDALGEKAYYLLTAVVNEHDGITQVLLRAASDKRHGLNGFLNEIVDNLRHLISSVASAREIGVIKKEQVINIIDSVVQRTTFAGGEGAASVNIEGSVVQRTEIRDDGEKRRREEEEEQERLKKQKEEEERARKEREEREKLQKEAEERQRKEKEEQERLRREEEGKRERLRREKEERLRKKKEEPERLAEQGNSIGMKFTLIPAGEFEMGSPPDEMDRYSDEGPVHHVTIENAFYMGRYEVTQKQWREIMGDNPSYFTGENLPVEEVSWDDVQEFIKKLNEKEGTDRYRLPSEAEWEYACRAGTTTRYSFGDSKSKLDDYAWYRWSKNSGSKTHPVGQKKPNPWGLYDMHGNVWEWVQDSWHRNYNSAPTDGSAWEGDGARRVGRGGGWCERARSCRSAHRLYDGRVGRVGVGRVGGWRRVAGLCRSAYYRALLGQGARLGTLGFRLLRST